MDVYTYQGESKGMNIQWYAHNGCIVCSHTFIDMVWYGMEGKHPDDPMPGTGLGPGVRLG